MRTAWVAATVVAALVMGGGVAIGDPARPADRSGAGKGSDDTGAGWQHPRIASSYVGFGDYTPAAGVSCLSESFCVVADANGNVSLYDGSSWSAPVRLAATYGVTPSVSCASERACVVVNSAGRAIRYNGQGWQQAVIVDPAGRPSGVSCPTDGFCVMVDRAGSAYTYRRGSWSAPTPIVSTQLTSVSCSTLR